MSDVCLISKDYGRVKNACFSTFVALVYGCVWRNLESVECLYDLQSEMRIYFSAKHSCNL